MSACTQNYDYQLLDFMAKNWCARQTPSTMIPGMPEPQHSSVVDLVAASRVDKSNLCNTIDEQMTSLGLPLGLAKGMVAAGVSPQQLADMLGRHVAPLRSSPQVWPRHGRP